MFTGKQIREKRESLKLSASMLAKILGVGKESIYKWEGGTKPSHHDMVVKIENWLNDVPQPKVIENGVDWQKKYYDLLEKYTALLEKMK